MLYRPGKRRFPASKTHDLNLQTLLLIDIWRSKTQEGLQGQDSPSLGLKSPVLKMSKPAQSTRKSRHLQRKLHSSSRHPIPNEVIEAKDDEFVFRHLKASLQRNPTSAVCPTQQTSRMGWESV